MLGTLAAVGIPLLVDAIFGKGKGKRMSRRGLMRRPRRGGRLLPTYLRKSIGRMEAQKYNRMRSALGRAGRQRTAQQRKAIQMFI